MVQRGDAATETTSVLSTKPLLTTHCQRHLGDPDQFPGFLKPPGSDLYWKVRMHGAFSVPRKALGLRPNDQSCHHETCLHLDFVDWRNTHSHHEEPDRRIFLKERPALPLQGAQKRKISDVMTDHSLSS